MRSPSASGGTSAGRGLVALSISSALLNPSPSSSRAGPSPPVREVLRLEDAHGVALQVRHQMVPGNGPSSPSVDHVQAVDTAEEERGGGGLVPSALSWMR